MNNVVGLNKPSGTQLPLGTFVGWDPRTKVHDSYRVLMGGSPWRLIRLDSRSAGLARRIHAAGTRGLRLESQWDAKAAGELLARGFLFPIAAKLESASEIDVVPEFSIVIPIFNRSDQLIELLTSVRTSDDQRSNIIVVDDGSRDPNEIARVATRFSTHYVRLPINKGPGAARNAGAQVCSSPYVVFLDSDCLPTHRWVERLLHHFADPHVGIVAPRVTSLLENSSALQRFEAGKSSLDMGPYPDQVVKGGRLGFIPSAALIVRHEVLEDISFDESMRVGEDVDFIWRVGEAGWRVNYDPSVIVFHRSRGNLRSWFERTFEYGTSAARLESLHPQSLIPARFSGWNVGMMAALIVNRKTGAAIIYAGAIGALAWRLRHLPRPLSMSARIVSFGLLADIEQAGRLLRREWWPLGAIALGSAPISKTGRRISAIMVVNLLNDWRVEKPQLDPLRYIAMRFAQDVAYGSGVMTSAAKARVWRPLFPTVSLPIKISQTMKRLRHRR